MKKVIIPAIIGAVAVVLAALISVKFFYPNRILEVQVRDSDSKQIIPNANIKLETEEKRSGDDGLAIFDNLKKGYRKIEVTKEKYRNFNGTIKITGKTNIAAIDLSINKDTTRIIASITNPQDNSLVISPVSISGIVENIPYEHHLWLVVNPHGTNGWWPQTREIIAKQNGNYSGSVILGGLNNKGQQFDIHLVLANNEANKSFNEYMSSGANTNSYPEVPLPEGAKSLTYITVTKR